MHIVIGGHHLYSIFFLFGAFFTVPFFQSGEGMIVFHLFFSAHNIGILLNFILLNFMMMMMNDNRDRDTEQHVKMNIYEMKQKVIDDDVVEDKRLKAKYDGDHMEVVASENGNMYFMDIDDRSMLNEILNQPMSSMSLMDRLKMEMEEEEEVEEEDEDGMVEEMEEEDGMVEDMEEEKDMEEEEKKKKDKKKKRKSKNKTAKKKGGKKTKKSNGKKKSKKNMKLAFYGRGKTIKHKKKTGKKKSGSSKSKSAKKHRK